MTKRLINFLLLLWIINMLMPLYRVADITLRVERGSDDLDEARRKQIEFILDQIEEHGSYTYHLGYRGRVARLFDKKVSQVRGLDEEEMKKVYVEITL